MSQWTDGGFAAVYTEPVAAADTVVVAPVADTLLTAGQPADAFFVRAQAQEGEGTHADTLLRRPCIAINTNLLFDYVTVFTGYNTVPVSLGVEVPIGQNWSATADYIISAPWHAWNNNSECVEVMHLSVGGRWYPGGIFRYSNRMVDDRLRVLDGMYAYASAGIGYFDFELGGKGYQGEDLLGTVGVGYSFTFSDNISLNLGVGFGPLFTRYRYYEGRSNNQHLMFQYRGTWMYFGPTDAKISLTWLFYSKTKKRNG